MQTTERVRVDRPTAGRRTAQSIIDTYLSDPNITMAEVARRHGVSRQYVFSVLRRNKINTHERHQRVTSPFEGREDLVDPVLQRLLEKNMTVREIAKDVGVSVYFVEEVARFYDVQPARYPNNRRIETLERYREIAEYAKEHPEQSYSEIGKIFGVSGTIVSSASRRFGYMRAPGRKKKR